MRKMTLVAWWACGAWLLWIGLPGSRAGMTPNPLRAQISTELLEWHEELPGGTFEDLSQVVRIAHHPLYPMAPLADIQRVGAAAHTGAYGYLVDAGAGESGWFAARGLVNKARDNIYGAWLRSPAAPRPVTLSISFEDSSNAVVTTEFSPAFLVGTNWTWCCFTNACKQNFHFAWFGLVVTENTLLHIDDMSIQCPAWKLAAPTGATTVVGGITVPAAPVAPVLFNLLIHIEDPIELYTDPIFFWRKSAVFEELARRCHEAGGFMTLQPEMEWVAAAASNAPAMIPHLVRDYGMHFSVHTHGPNCLDSNGVPWGATACDMHHASYTGRATDADAVTYCGDRARFFGAQAGTNVLDNNGNWDLTNMAILAQAGFTTLSGFKNHNTQRSFDEYFTNPWRPSACSPINSPTGYEVHDPFGKIIYVPGIGASISKIAMQIQREMEGYLSQAIANAETGRVNTCYIITHVDSFFSTNELPFDQYIDYDPATSNYTYSQDFLSDLAFYSNTLFNLVKPLADAGYVQWTDLPAVGDQFLAWEKRQAGLDALALAAEEGRAWLGLALSNAIASRPFWNRLHVPAAGDDLAPDAGRPDSLAPTAGQRTGDLRDWLRWGNDYLDGLTRFGASDASNNVLILLPSVSNSLLGADGVVPGDPFAADRTLENLKAVFRHPAGAGATYTNAGYAYRALDDVVAAQPGRLFLVVTPPPAHYAPSDATTDADAARARALAAWIAGDWLAAYHTAHPGLNNVAVFDWFGHLATDESDPAHPNRLRAEYGGDAGTSVPNGLACSNTAAAFIGGYSNAVDAAWRQFLARGATNVLAPFHVVNVTWTSGRPCLAWESVTGVTYGLDFAPALTSALPWRRMLHITGAAGTQTVADAFTTNLTNGFYRVTALTGRVDYGQTLITFVDVAGLGNVAVEIITPTNARYAGGQVSAMVPTTGFLFSYDNFRTDINFSDLGLLHVSYLWPGCTDRSGAASAGTYDYAGPEGIRALAEVLRFVGGQRPDYGGRYLHELVQCQPRYEHTGIYAGSHPGIAAANVLGMYGGALTNVAFFVGWENPTMDAIVTMDAGGVHVPLTPVNPGYHYPADYTPTNVVLPYHTIRWAATADPFPYFDLNSNGVPDIAADYLFDPPAHQMFATQFYSRAVLHALEDNGQLPGTNWPAWLARPAQADEAWGWRDATARYPALVTNAPQLKAILVFGKGDHAQIAVDKPHVHHAWNGLRMLPSRWVRLNPDRAYVTAQNAAFGATAPDNPANAAPPVPGWVAITNWAYDSAFPNCTAYAVKAAAAELADRCHYTNWSTNLTSVLGP